MYFISMGIGALVTIIIAIIFYWLGGKKASRTDEKVNGLYNQLQTLLNLMQKKENGVSILTTQEITNKETRNILGQSYRQGINDAVEAIDVTPELVSKIRQLVEAPNINNVKIVYLDGETIIQYDET